MDTFLIRVAHGVSFERAHRRLTGEAGARILLSIKGGNLLVVQFDRALRDAVARWPEIAVVGGVTFAGRQIRRIRVDQNGRLLPPAAALLPAATTP